MANDIEGRSEAKALHNAVSNDLRFADAKALFVALVVGGWVQIVRNYITAPLSINNKVDFWVKTAFIATATCSICVALWAIIPGGRLLFWLDRRMFHRVAVLNWIWKSNTAKAREQLRKRQVVDATGKFKGVGSL